MNPDGKYSLHILLVILACCYVITVQAGDNNNITIKEAWIREAPPNAPVMAAYMTVENHSDKIQSLQSVTSTAFERVELHVSMEKDGMAVMEKQDKLDIKPRGKLVLEPGGLHIMLIAPKKRYKAGDEISLVLQFTDGSEYAFAAMVMKKAGAHHHDSHEQHDKHEHHHDH